MASPPSRTDRYLFLYRKNNAVELYDGTGSREVSPAELTPITAPTTYAARGWYASAVRAQHLQVVGSSVNTATSSTP